MSWIIGGDGKFKYEKSTKTQKPVEPYDGGVCKGQSKLKYDGPMKHEKTCTFLIMMS